MTWSGLADASKAVAAALGALAILGYVTGYLVLRARAHALGIAPSFDLLDEVYVFAGFRFLISALVLLALAAPVLAVAVAGAGWLKLRLPPSAVLPFAWAGLAAIAVAVLILLSDVLAIRDLLFVAGDANGAATALPTYLDPRRPGYGPRVLGLELLAVALAALTAIWLARTGHARQRLAVGLALVLALQLFHLPVLHGALRADRVVPVLQTVPDSASALEGTALIVDRNATVATLFGRTGPSEAALVTIPAEDLHGLPQGRPVTLFAPAQPAPRGTGLTLAAGHAAAGMRTLAAAGPETEDGFLAAVTDRLGRLLENLGALSDTDRLAGQVIEAHLAADGTVLGTRTLSAPDAALAWPVTGEDGAVFALQDGAVVRVGTAGSLTVVEASLRWRKLIGVLPSGAVVGLATVGQAPGGAMVDPGHRTAAPTTIALPPPTVATLLAGTFAHRSGDILEVNRSARGGRGLDVYLIRDGIRRDVSGCGDARCVQPSLSADRDRVLFVRAPAN